jgi:FkbM family methyltransferase
MEEFIWNESFRNQLQDDAHHNGELVLLESVLKSGMRVIDAGAHSGISTAAMAKMVGENGHVYAFEPVPEYFSLLRKNMHRNRIGNISMLNLALSDKGGYVPFYKHGEGSGVTAFEHAEKTMVYATTVSDFIKIHDTVLDFINLDCEGSEMNVLRGAKPLLIKMKPGIFCEVHRDNMKALSQSVNDIVDFLRGIGYSVTPIQVEQLGSESNFDDCSHMYATAE